MRHHVFLTIGVIVECLLSVMTPARAQERSVTFNESYLVTHNGVYCDVKVSIGREVYDGYFRFPEFTTYAPMVFDIKGYDHFTAFVGAMDGNVTGKITIEVDRQEIWSHEVRKGDASVAIDIPITGARSMAITVSHNQIVLGEPKLTNGRPKPTGLIAQLIQLLLDLRASAQAGNQQPIVEAIDQRLDKMGVALNITPRYVEWHLR